MPWLTDIQGVVSFPEVKKRSSWKKETLRGGDCEERMEVGKRGNFQQTGENNNKKF